MNHREPPVLLHNMSAPPRTAVNTMLPLLCPQGSKGQAPLFSLPHALVLSGNMTPGKGEFPELSISNWMTNGGLINDRLWTEGSAGNAAGRVRTVAHARRTVAPPGLMELPALPAGLHFLIGTELRYAQKWEVFGGGQ
jgi:hypothetical protein